MDNQPVGCTEVRSASISNDALRTAMPTVNLSVLPKSIAELVRSIGLPATLKLMQTYGGTTQYIPRPENLTPEHTLVQLIGWQAACTLAENCRGGTLHIAKGCASMRAVRNAQIVHDYYVNHHSQSDLALAYGLDVRQIRTIIGSTPLQAADQLDLFA